MNSLLMDFQITRGLPLLVLRHMLEAKPCEKKETNAFHPSKHLLPPPWVGHNITHFWLRTYNE